LTSPVGSPVKQQYSATTPTKRRRTLDYWALKAAAREKDANKEGGSVENLETQEVSSKNDDKLLIKDLAVGF